MYKLPDSSKAKPTAARRGKSGEFRHSRFETSSTKILEFNSVEFFLNLNFGEILFAKNCELIIIGSFFSFLLNQYCAFLGPYFYPKTNDSLHHFISIPPNKKTALHYLLLSIRRKNTVLWPFLIFWGLKMIFFIPGSNFSHIPVNPSGLFLQHCTWYL